MALILRTPSHRFWRNHGSPQAWFTLTAPPHKDSVTRKVARAGSDAWDPTVTVRKKDGRLKYRIVVEGADPDDLNVIISESEVIISGKRRREHETGRCGYEWHEVSNWSFSRSLKLPRSVDWLKAEATFEDGVLEIGMNIIDDEPKRIEIQAVRQ